MVPDFIYEAGEARVGLFSEGIKKAVADGFREVPERTPYSIVLLGKGGKITHVAIYHPSGIYYHSLERFGVVGHTKAVLASTFDTFSYWWC